MPTTNIGIGRASNSQVSVLYWLDLEEVVCRCSNNTSPDCIACYISRERQRRRATSQKPSILPTQYPKVYHPPEYDSIGSLLEDLEPFLRYKTYGIGQTYSEDYEMEVLIPILDSRFRDVSNPVDGEAQFIPREAKNQDKILLVLGTPSTASNMSRTSSLTSGESNESSHGNPSSITSCDSVGSCDIEEKAVQHLRRRRSPRRKIANHVETTTPNPPDDFASNNAGFNADEFAYLFHPSFGVSFSESSHDFPLGPAEPYVLPDYPKTLDLPQSPNTHLQQMSRDKKENFESGSHNRAPTFVGLKMPSRDIVLYSEVQKPNKTELNLDEQNQLREDLYSICSSNRNSSLAVLGLPNRTTLPDIGIPQLPDEPVDETSESSDGQTPIMSAKKPEVSQSESYYEEESEVEEASDSVEIFRTPDLVSPAIVEPAPSRRFHCTVSSCTDDNGAGFSTEQALRTHKKRMHVLYIATLKHCEKPGCENNKGRGFSSLGGFLSHQKVLHRRAAEDSHHCDLPGCTNNNGEDDNLLLQRIAVVIADPIPDDDNLCDNAARPSEEYSHNQRSQPHEINRNSPSRSVATESQQSHSVEKTADDCASTGHSSSHKSKSRAGISTSTKSSTSDSEVEADGGDEDEDEDDDYEEDDDDSDSPYASEDEDLRIYELFLDKNFYKNVEHQPDSARLFLERLKKRLVDRVMTEFWAIFNQEWFPSPRVSTHATLPVADQNSGTSYNDKTNETSQGSIKKNEKRRLSDDDQDEPEDENARNPKHPKVDVALPADRLRLPFACPFRKHDPFKYSTVNRHWHGCATTPYRTIARLKEHLTRAHRIWQCPRCKNTFRSKTLNDNHVLAEPACDVVYLGPDDIQQPSEGITEGLAEWLRRKGKAYRKETGQSYYQQSEEDRWRTIYRKFFPNEQVPSPYFDEPRIEESQTPNSSVLAIYEDFRRREVPRMVRSVLETEVEAEFDPISRATADRLYGRLITIMQDAQEQAYNQFHRQYGGSSNQMAENMSSLPPLALPTSESPGEEDLAESVNDQEMVMSSLNPRQEPHAIEALRTSIQARYGVTENHTSSYRSSTPPLDMVSSYNDPSPVRHLQPAEAFESQTVNQSTAAELNQLLLEYRSEPMIDNLQTEMREWNDPDMCMEYFFNSFGDYPQAKYGEEDSGAPLA